jgi:hypothetical protein
MDFEEVMDVTINVVVIVAGRRLNGVFIGGARYVLLLELVLVDVAGWFMPSAPSRFEYRVIRLGCGQ